MKNLFIKSLLCLAVVLLPMMASAQTDTYEDYRKKLLSDYSQFRKSVLDGYADYLSGIWSEYQAFKGEKRDIRPKPVTPPDVDTTPPVPPFDDEPIIVVPDDTPEPTPVHPLLTPPTPPAPPAPAPDDNTYCTFYGQKVKIPRLKCLPVNSLEGDDVADAWRTYTKNKTQQQVAQLLSTAQALQLNDWFTFELARETVLQQCTANSSLEHTVLLHFIAANMGYDVRLAKCDDTPVLLLPFTTTIYERSYINIDDIKYYIYPIGGSDLSGIHSLYTCDLPKNIDLGRVINPSINTMLMGSGHKRQCTLVWKDIEVTAEVDEGTMEMVRRYPQMEIPLYAMSTLNSQLRKSVLEQLRPHIDGLSKTEAANKLLHFVQHCFRYATDDEQHGYEKTYFFEENFYYPKNDCEDRAVFYAYLVRHLIGLDVHLIYFPGHECTAVCFNTDEVRGTGYRYDGRTYMICDPTYIGADIGMCMPQYRDVEPSIQKW